MVKQKELLEKLKNRPWRERLFDYMQSAYNHSNVWDIDWMINELDKFQDIINKLKFLLQDKNNITNKEINQILDDKSKWDY